MTFRALRRLRKDLDDARLRRRLDRGIPGFDPGFYRKRYRDLAELDAIGVARHWLAHGRREGRAGTPDGLIAQIEARLGALPPDFDPVVYRSLYPDLGPVLADDWEATAHYLEFGRPEERPYRIETDALAKAFRDLLVDEAGGKPVPADAFARFLDRHGLSTGVWLRRFDLAEFTLLNADWIGRPLASRADGIRVFVERGIDRLAPPALALAFDPAFYRLHYGLGDGGGDADLYRSWLTDGIHRARVPNEAARLVELLGTTVFPAAFDEAAYRAALGPGAPSPGPGRLAALEHAIAVGVPAGLAPFPPDAADLHEAAGDYHRVRSEHAIALRSYDRAVAAAPGSGRVREKRGLVRLDLLDPAGAAEDFLAATDLPGATPANTVSGAEALTALGRHEDALALMERTAARSAGTFAWREAARAVLAGLFAAGSEAARTRYAAGDRAGGDLLMHDMLARIAQAWPGLSPMPAPLPKAGRGRVAILANLDLPQCVHYRVEQRRRQLVAGGWQVTVHDQGDTEGFRQALHEADAAIVYRAPAFPEVVRAILYARALGLPTFYECDDLIFDAGLYPDPFESFEGAISEAEHVGLQYGVPLFRFALTLCDEAIASTPSLAERMAPLTRSGRCHVVRNGLDERNRPFLVRDLPQPGETVTIVYGSGTRAHNRDFSELVAPALLDVLASRPQVRLLIAGHLPDDPRFDPFHGRVRRLGFTADVDSYWEVLSGADVNLAVLAPGAAADAKSEIKWLEAAVSGVPSVVSPTRTFREALRDGHDVLFASAPDEWRRALLRLVDDPGLRRRIGREARVSAVSRYGIESGIAALGTFLPKPSPPAAAPRAKPRLLVVNVFFPPQTIGGATRVVRNNVDWLLDHASDRLDIFAAASDEWAEPVGSVRIDSYRDRPVIRIAPPIRYNTDWYAIDEEMGAVFEHVLERLSPDLVHFHCVQRLTASVVDVTRARNIPHLVTLHDGWWLSDHQFLVDGDGMPRPPSRDPAALAPPPGVTLLDSIARSRRAARALEGADALLAVSETFAGLYREAGFPHTVAVPNGIPPLPSVSRRPAADGRVRLGHIGGRSTHKGATLVEAVLRATPFRNLRLTIIDLSKNAGYGHEEVWGTTPVEVIGRVPEAAVGELYAELDVLLAPSTWPESFGLVAREARALGLWVVASDRGAMAEDLRPGIDGFVVDVSSPDPLRTVLREIDGDPARFTTSPPPRPAGAVRTADDQAADLLALYERILAR